MVLDVEGSSPFTHPIFFKCARSSVGQSAGLRIRRPQVRILPGVSCYKIDFKGLFAAAFNPFLLKLRIMLAKAEEHLKADVKVINDPGQNWP